VNDRDPDAAYHRLVDRTRHAILTADWPRVVAVHAELPTVLDDALAGLTSAQLAGVLLER
jgi:hypothetical protein